MATTLKDLKITSTDLVDRGANPQARICLFKRNEISKNEEMVEKKMEFDFKQMSEDDRNTLEELARKYKKEEGDVVGKSTTEDTSVELEQAPSPAPSPTSVIVGKSEVIGDIPVENSETIAKMAIMADEIAILKKALALKELEGVSEKYEVLGNKKEELAKKLYEMKEAGENVFKSYVEALNGQLDLLEKRDLFTEIGSNYTGGKGIDANIDGIVSDIMKKENITKAEAVVKAYETNPDLAHEYENRYFGMGV